MKSLMVLFRAMAFVLLQHFVIEIRFLPALEHVRLPLGETGAHGKVGFGQVQCGVIIL